MFVRFETRRPKRGRGLLVLKLAESHRVEGKPRQEIIAHLGSLRLDVAELPHDGLKTALWLGALWERIDERLETLANRLLPEQRVAIEGAIAKVELAGRIIVRDHQVQGRLPR